MSTRPRNPRYFPRMKVRGKSRRYVAPVQRLAGAFDRLNIVMPIAAQSLYAFANISIPAANLMSKES